jgi:hypothetical protein
MISQLESPAVRLKTGRKKNERRNGGRGAIALLPACGASLAGGFAPNIFGYHSRQDVLQCAHRDFHFNRLAYKEREL